MVPAQVPAWGGAGWLVGFWKRTKGSFLGFGEEDVSHGKCGCCTAVKQKALCPVVAQAALWNSLPASSNAPAVLTLFSNLTELESGHINSAAQAWGQLGRGS